MSVGNTRNFDYVLWLISEMPSVSDVYWPIFYPILLPLSVLLIPRSMLITYVRQLSCVCTVTVASVTENRLAMAESILTIIYFVQQCEYSEQCKWMTTKQDNNANTDCSYYLQCNGPPNFEKRTPLYLAIDFKFGKQLKFAMVHHKITPITKSGRDPELGELLKICGSL